jgi:hypothetical protein
MQGDYGIMESYTQEIHYIRRTRMTATVEIISKIENVRERKTHSGKPMATFVIGGTLSAKCFDENVAAVTQAGSKGARVSLIGNFTAYKGQIEFAAESIATAFMNEHTHPEPAQPGEEAVAEKAPEDGTDIVKGIVRDIKRIPTRSGQPMVTFRMGQYRCKAFGENAEAVAAGASSLEGKPQAFSGHWETNSRGNREFIAQYVYAGSASKFDCPVQPEQVDVPESTNRYVPTNQVVPATAQVQCSTPEELIVQVRPSEKQEPAQDPSAVQVEPTEGTIPKKLPEIEGVIHKIGRLESDSSGCNKIYLWVGDKLLSLYGPPADFVSRHRSEYQGKRISVSGEWEVNEEGQKEFVLECDLPQVEPEADEEVTADEVHEDFKRALLDVVYANHELWSHLSGSKRTSSFYGKGE